MNRTIADSTIQNNLHTLSHSIHQTAKQYLTATPTLIAVSKHQSIQKIQLAADAGHINFGENYAQEGVQKIMQLKQRYPNLIWHMLGAIQSNKTRLIAEHFDWVHSINYLHTAQRLSNQRPDYLPQMNVLIQVNIDREPNKQGVYDTDTFNLALQIATLPRLKLRGLMAIPAKHSPLGFKCMANLYCNLKQNLPTDIADSFNVLSMGMSQDFVLAIAHGATHLRLGTAIFGDRVYS